MLNHDCLGLGLGLGVGLGVGVVRVQGQSLAHPAQNEPKS
ncbi:hypothetical protein Thi970DRAFT_04015 [Thiorhodovibrio frisius]|uniref:Uncharacterized protein n=1 Tax=Thiorhodovibrio frisius TaxID=631362 RepID=H8Z4X5_9GAMM|nr:hypothetical protein Thi970DRAFT_04015 [Thiorhodovibrio frisius]WPL21124.1 hypothetical protein Thiofri_01232 [Thiorhodovibrio frisius]